MINVAVSRAKNRLILVTNSNVLDKPSNVKDLVDYMEYNNFEVRESNINFCFLICYMKI